MKKTIIAAVLLTACAKPDPVIIAPACPQVPQCIRPQIAIATNADLIRAYQATDSALAQCTIARDTLAACLKNQESHQNE
ncbi:Rz1-like lysis system protein LysC [Neisseriaceae bacterium B1]